MKLISLPGEGDGGALSSMEESSGLGWLEGLRRLEGEKEDQKELLDRRGVCGMLRCESEECLWGWMEGRWLVLRGSWTDSLSVDFSERLER